MGICISKEKNKYIKSKYIKDTSSVISNENNTNNSNSKKYTFIKYLKSLKNLNDIENRLSKLTKYEDINQYYTSSNKKITENDNYIIYLAKKIDSPKKEYNYLIKKVFKSKNDDQINISLIKEIKINMMIHHENIVKCHDIFEDDLSVYFVYEYMPKGDLENYLLKKRKHRLKDKKIIIILEQMLLALIYLHEKIKVIHRDIKPNNFLLKKEDKKIIIKLKDFDSAEFIKEEGFINLIKGTPLYIAPEIYLEQNYNSKIDMWGIGMTLYYMLTGCNPFEINQDKNKLKPAKNRKEDLDFSILEENKSLKHILLNQEIDFMAIKHLGLRKLVQGLLERNPNKRLSALEALEELNKIKKGGNLYISKSMKESPIKLKRVPSVFENDLEKNIFSKSKHFFIYRNETMNDLNKNNVEDLDCNNIDDLNDMTSEFSDIKNISRDNATFNYNNRNEIKIIIKKKK